MEPGGVAGGDARSGDTGPLKGATGPGGTREGKLSLLLFWATKRHQGGATDVWGDLEEALQR